MQNSISGLSNAILNVILLALVLACLLPLLLVISVSVTDEVVLLEHGYRFIPAKLSFESFSFLWNVGGAGILQAYGVTILVTAAGTVLSLAVVALYAYPLSRRDLQHRNFFMFFLFFTMLFSGGIVPWYLICTQVLHIQNTVWALIVPYVMNGFYVIVLRTFFMNTIPAELLESAKIDGAGEWKTFLRIVIPLSLPGLATIGIFAAVMYWNDYFLPLMLITEPELSNLQYMIYRIMMNIQFLSEYGTKVSDVRSAMASAPTESVRMAIAVLTIGPIVLIYPFLQKYFIKGLTIGAIKG